MTKRIPVTDHPRKVQVEGFEPDGSLKAEDGWINMSVKWGGLRRGGG